MRREMMLGGAVVVAIGVGGCDTGVRNPATVPATNIAETRPAMSQPAATRNAEGYTSVSPAEFEQLAKQRGVVILDVQPDSYYAQGYIAGSVHYNGQTPRDAFRAALPTMDRNATYLVYCVGGYISRDACTQMAEAGFKNLYNLGGGIRAWKNSGRPVETPATQPAATRNAEGYTDVTAAEFEQLAKQGGVVILDVQPDSYYAQGSIAGSIHYNVQRSARRRRRWTTMRPIWCIARGA